MIISFREFNKFPVLHGISDRQISHEDFLKKLEIPPKGLVRLQQVHGGKVVKIDARTALSGEIPGADGAITDVKGITLSVRTADCLPMLLYDPEHNAIGVAHAGWKSTKEKIAKNVVEAMRSEYRSAPAKLFAGMGPALRQCCYEVNSEFLVHFPDSVVKMAHKHYFDLVGENAEQLIAAGISAKNIFDCGICTACKNGEFFSFRKEKDKAGRMLSVIMLK
ncbi:MAG: peptidoglycan editing factor PgeF [Candidatus Omnitrophica bacterium]|nr:peptidoglycan editing factor PgeF [Candidatus Omnitrophota bacterium]MDD5546162.1 peptidoglycan editing factor PgeF [Candidatus Omnitrophota bacterium]